MVFVQKIYIGVSMHYSDNDIMLPKVSDNDNLVTIINDSSRKKILVQTV